MSITQSEFDYIICQEKEFVDLATPIQLGPAPIQWTRRINSSSTRETFLLDFYRGSFEISKYVINKRYKQTVILLRYDNCGRHTNPDGEQFEGPHIHLYREGFNDKFAFLVSIIGIRDSDPMEQVFNKIMYFCNVKKLPNVEVPMF